MSRIYWTFLRALSLVLSLGLGLFALGTEVLAQATPQPSRPSGSNPSVVAPTDVPIEWSLFWVLMFFVVLLLGLLFANWLVRRGTFGEPEQPQ